MKSIINLKNGSRAAWSYFNLLFKSIIFIAFILTGIQATSQITPPAQADQYTKPVWLFGVAAGANFNFYRGTTQELNSDLTVPAAFRHGDGIGTFLAPLVEYHNPDSIWGIMLQAGYDSRRGSFEQVKGPCNCPEDLSTNLRYITIEPSFRIAPFKSNFYLYAGPRLAFNLGKDFFYKQGINPAFPQQVANPNIKEDFGNINKMLISMQIGAGYDIPISKQNKKTQFLLSPFVSYQPYFGQKPRSIETWEITTFRAGIAFKFGPGRLITQPEKEAEYIPLKAVKDTTITFSVYAPKNIPVERRVKETFPIRNYIFFDIGSTDIPDRYVLLTKDKVKEFTNDRLEVFTPKSLIDRSNRQLIAYYNILNILGTRMVSDSLATITLVGSSEKGPADGKEMSESVKRYLVGIFGINTSRIATEGRNKPKISSEKPGSNAQLALMREGDRRVSIESTSPSILMEYQTGPNVPLKPVDINVVQEVPIDAYLSFKVVTGIEALKSWSVVVTGDSGQIKNFGPYTQKFVDMKGRAVLGTRPEGNYKFSMIGHRLNGKTVIKDTTAHMVLWKPSEREEGMRYTVLFEFDESKEITLYDKYLTEIVVPKIPINSKVIIHGHTDIIGDSAHNQQLSEARANDVYKVIKNAVSKAGRNDVTYEVYGFGENQDLAPFENNYPEERFYNRTVIIDIIPKK
jgi:outer membrane protein OmpA-like peptidoglycan-associated protein